MSDPHRRFTEWLLEGAEGDPPRDLAVHAWVCGQCRAAIDALDALAAVDVGAASLPAPTRPIAHRERQTAFRSLLTTAVVLVAAAGVGIGGWRALDYLRSRPHAIAAASPTPNQEVMGGSGTPEATATAVPTPEPTSTPIPSIATLPPSPTPRPGATATPRPVATPRPTAVPSPVPTGAPTPVPTPVPTAPGAPVLSVSGSLVGDRPELAWTAPSDGGSPIIEYVVYRGTVSGTYLELTRTTATGFFDDLAETGTLYYYVVQARNAVDLGPMSNEVSYTPTL